MVPFGFRAQWSQRLDARSERLQRRSPRVLELVCALVMTGIALEFVSEVVFAEWFYFRYHRDYAYTPQYRMHEWIYGLSVLLLAWWMLVMAWKLVRGAAGQSDNGLFSPGALRLWGTGFALVPLAMIISSPESILHVHMIFWFWGAAFACFTLAARRSKAARKPAPTARRAEPGPPPPIG